MPFDECVCRAAHTILLISNAPIGPFRDQPRVWDLQRRVKSREMTPYSRNTLTSLSEPGFEVSSPVRVVAPWPAIDGVDAVDARDRWCGDVGLFLSMLERLLDEFSEVAVPAAAHERVGRKVYIARMHKLRGEACTLAAMDVAEIAGQVEAACIGLELERARSYTGPLAYELGRLRLSAQPLFAAARAIATK
jgi:hypothetical protein